MGGMIVLLGASGYIGQAFARELARRRWEFLPLSRRDVDYSRFDVLLKFLRENRAEFLINAAGYAGQPNVDACEIARAETLQGNVLLPITIAHACAETGTPWGHVSSGCIYDGAFVTENGARRMVENPAGLLALQTRNPTRHREALWRSGEPETRNVITGFKETDEPNFTFRHPPCSFYSGSKALAEEALAGVGRVYLWRLRIPFDESDAPKNYLSKLLRYRKLYDAVNSLSHLGDATRAALDLWERRAPFGPYHLTNPGFVTTRQLTALIGKHLRPDRTFHFFADDEEFYRVAAKAPRSSCVLDVSKLRAAGVPLRPVTEALEDALIHWRPGAE